MDIKNIRELVKLVSESNITEVKLEEGDFKITVSKRHGMAMATVQAPQQMMYQPQAAPAPVAAAPAAPQADTAAPAAPAGNIKEIKSPMVGTFYRAAGPGKPSFVQVGDTIEKGKPVCIIEAMKLFNEVEAEITGKIVKVLVDDASPVEFDQPLFLVEV